MARKRYESSIPTTATLRRNMRTSTRTVDREQARVMLRSAIVTIRFGFREFLRALWLFLR